MGLGCILPGLLQENPMKQPKVSPSSPATKPKVVIEITGGICQAVFSTSPVEVTVRDFDNI